MMMTQSAGTVRRWPGSCPLICAARSRTTRGYWAGATRTSLRSNWLATGSSSGSGSAGTSGGSEEGNEETTAGPEIVIAGSLVAVDADGQQFAEESGTIDLRIVATVVPPDLGRTPHRREQRGFVPVAHRVAVAMATRRHDDAKRPLGCCVA